jgi:AAA+ superfamily predicted ATPase
LRLHFTPNEPGPATVLDLPPPDLSQSDSEYARFLLHYRFTFAERLALVLALVPQLRPQLLDPFYTRSAGTDRRVTDFGGYCERGDGEFLPTGETLAFLLGGADLALRFHCQLLFDPQHVFSRHRILRSAAPMPELPIMKAPLLISEELLSLFTTGQERRPAFGASFPAMAIETNLTWEDVVLAPATRKQVEEIRTWIDYGPQLLNEWGMAAKLRPGYRALFYGPPGTGKTMTACLVGKSSGRDVYKVDLSLVMSKYIGETEKNLARVFDQAEHKNWILFFDEADALFGKRSETRDAHDRYANQEVAFLLQRIETFDGIAILASNLRDNVDDAFARRFESVIYFPMPRAEERLRLWRQGFSPQATLDRSVDLEALARERVLSGGAIMNVIRYASLQALKGGGRPITADDLLVGVQRELAKEGKAA